MKSFPQIALCSAIALATALVVSGCHSNPDQASADTQNPSQDPADANLAPASDTTTAAAPAAAPQAAPAPQPASSSAAPATDASYESTPEDTGEQPVAQATQPPPPLPEYSQPACPGDGYIWTPGYWGYQPTGYYWVPGVWTRAPYEGALWTPPYWGWRQGFYALFPGHWGTHIGYYGGINYGFGYVGLGYHGGYWNGGHFFYNRTVNNVNTTVIHNVYTYNIVNKTTIINNTRVSYNGGRGGVPVRPRPEEVVTVREPRAAVMATQIQHEQAARADHDQFEPVNHGHPARPVIEHPIEADRDVHPVVRPPVARPEPHAPVPGGRSEPEHREARPAEKHPEPKHK